MYCAQLQYRNTCTYRSQRGNPLLFAPPLVSHVEHEEEDREESRNGVEESRQLETINFRVGKRSMIEDESCNTIKFLSSAQICPHTQCMDTVVSHIYAPPFATLMLVESVGGAYMRDLTFYPANMPPLPLPRLDVDILNIILQTDRSCRSALATSSENRWSRSTDRGWPQHRQRHFPSVPRVCPYDVLLLIDTTRGHASESTANSLAFLWTLAPFLRCHGDLELDSVGVLTKIILVEWPLFGEPIREIKIPVQEVWLKT